VNPDRLMRLENSQTSIARKVLDAVPIQESWPLKLIISEIARRGIKPDAHAIEGCLGTIVDDGLVKKNSHGEFQRVSAKPREETNVRTLPNQVKEVPQEPPVILTTSDKLIKLGVDLRAMANVADELALEVETMVANSSEELQKLRQLKDLLRGLN
jgi:hypothetical protein